MITNANSGTCMDYTGNPGTNQHDYDQHVTIYSHLDSTTTIGAAPLGFKNADMSTAAQWGRLLHTSRDGHLGLYMGDFGGGHKIFTFVYWAM